jgi:hypothetical protein
MSINYRFSSLPDLAEFLIEKAQTARESARKNATERDRIELAISARIYTEMAQLIRQCKIESASEADADALESALEFLTGEFRTLSNDKSETAQNTRANLDRAIRIISHLIE